MKTTLPVLSLVLTIALGACETIPTKPEPTSTSISMADTSASNSSANALCLSCHGNEDLVMSIGNEQVPLYVNQAAYAVGKHGKTECIACHTGMNPTPPHNALRKYGSWARFSAKDTDTTKTRNYYNVDGAACLTCHKQVRYSEFMKSEHATIKDMKFESDGKPRVETKVKGTDGRRYFRNETFAGNESDCERCHIQTNCGTCHWKTKSTQKQAGNIIDLWTKHDNASEIAKGEMTEYSMDWTVNIASHEFNGKSALTKSNAVCTACHVGYYQGDRSVPALGIQGMGVRRYPQVQEMQLSSRRGVHSSLRYCTDCHTELHDLKLNNSEQGGRLGGRTRCTNCHVDKLQRGAHVDVTCVACHDAELTVQRDDEMKKIVPMAVKFNRAETWSSHNLATDVKCGKCHYDGNNLGAPLKFRIGLIH